MTLKRKDWTRAGKTNHSYTLDGAKIKGVTTLISAGLPKPALQYWSARQVAEYVADNLDAVVKMAESLGRGSLVDALRNVPWDKRDEAAARGTDIHRIADEIINGGVAEVPDAIAGYVQGYVDWLDAWGVTVNGTELSCARRPAKGVPGYAGTFDADVNMTKGPLAGKRGLVDWKTSKGVYGDQALQLAGYANADFFLDADGNEQPMPEFDFLGVVHITPTGTDLYLVRDPAAAWRAFQHVAYVGTQTDFIETQLAEPTPMPTEATA